MSHPLTRRNLMASSLLMAACAPMRSGAPGVQAASGLPLPLPYGPVPSPRQLKWHDRQLYAFVHFSINTFTDKEWGYGDEDPALFNPSDFDADQIVAAAVAGGMTGLILTAKHHDGFCLWPTQLTEHCVRNSPWRGGQGDVVREVEQACRRAGIAFGLYISPWDRNHPEYGRPAYVDYYRAQVTELCTRYGPLFEVWFDGANGGDGFYGGARETRKIDAPRYYDWPSIVALVHRLQPDACTFDPLGADLRWVGNEEGHAGDPCWPTMPNAPYTMELGYTGQRGGALWWPAETDVSIRPGWFYHPDEDTQVKTPQKLMEIFDRSVGHGSNLLLNLSPDRRGRIPDRDLASLQAFGDALRATFAQDLARGAVATASADIGRTAAHAIDGQPDTFWCAPPNARNASLTLELAPGTRFDTIVLREWLPLGLRTTRFAIEVAVGSTGDGWRELARREMVGPHRIIRLPAPVEAKRLRLRCLEAEAGPTLRELALYLATPPATLPDAQPSNPSHVSRRQWKVLQASAPGAEAALDEDPNTLWRAPVPAQLSIDLGGEQSLAGFTLTPSHQHLPDAAAPGRWQLQTSLDGQQWSAVEEGEFSNIHNARSLQRVAFAAPRTLRYLRLAFARAAVPAAAIAVASIGAFR